MNASDLQKATTLVRERDGMLAIIGLITDTDDFLFKDKDGRLYQRAGEHQLSIPASFVREGLLKWAKAELLLIDGALAILGVETTAPDNPASKSNMGRE